jgi:hypothetical protein
LAIRKPLIETFSNPGAFPKSFDTYPYNWLTSRHQWDKTRQNLRKSPLSRDWKVTTGLCLTGLFDVYTLARMFKPVFRSSQVAIVYAGAAHAAKMIYFIRKHMKATKVYVQPRIDRGFNREEPQCLKVDGKFKEVLVDIASKRREPCTHSRRVFGKGERSTPRYLSEF